MLWSNHLETANALQSELIRQAQTRHIRKPGLRLIDMTRGADIAASD